MTIYLDYNATTPVHPEVLDEMVLVYRENYGNAASHTHIYGHRANQVVDRARKAIAELLQVAALEIIFTSGATESNNISLLGLTKQSNKRHIISTSIEHNAVLEPLQYLAEQGYEIELVNPDQSGRVSAEDVLSRVRPDTLLVSVMHANNETGVIQPVDVIGEALQKTDVFFHVDASQTFGKLVDDLREVQYDLLSCTAHKIYGPQGIGALVVRQRRNRRMKLQPLLFGGGQERGIRPGTVPVALAAGFGKAVELAGKHYKEWNAHSQKIKEDILRQLQGVKFTVNGDLKHSLPHCVNISFDGVNSEALMLSSKNDIAISNGSACTSSDTTPSHVLLAMDAEAEYAVRLSWGPNTPDIDLSSLLLCVKSFQ